MTNVQLGGTATASTPMNEEWAGWIATNALGGVPSGEIYRLMVEAGFDQATATREVNSAFSHPYLKAASQLGVGASAGALGGSTRADKYSWFLDNSRRLGRLSSKYGEVPRVQKPSPQKFLDKYYSQNRPCIIEGAMDDWPALTKWTGDYLKEVAGDKVVEVQANRESDGDFEINAAKLKKEMLFSEIVDIIENTEETNNWYLTANNSGRNMEALKALRDDFSCPEYLDGSASHGNGYFWYGPAGTVTPIHHDLTNNFMAQVRGRKRVKIVAPQDSASVYNHHHCFSPVDMENPDLERFPEWANVDVIDVELGPGDLFFLPVGWWHHVRGLETSITLTFTNFIYENDFSSDYKAWGDIA